MTYVLFDTNISNSQLGLTTRNAAAVRFFFFNGTQQSRYPRLFILN